MVKISWVVFLLALILSIQFVVGNDSKDGGKDGSKDGGKDGDKDGGKEKDGSKDGSKDGGKDGGKEKDGGKDGSKDGGKEALSPETKQSDVYRFYEIILKDLKDAGTIDDKAVSSEKAQKMIKKSVEMLEEKRKNIKSQEEAKQVAKKSLQILVEELGQAGVIDKHEVHKKLFPKGHEDVSPMVEKAFTEIIKEDLGKN